MFSEAPFPNNTDQEAPQIYEMAYRDGKIVFLAGNTVQNETQQVFEFTHENLNVIPIEINQKALQKLEAIYQNPDITRSFTEKEKFYSEEEQYLEKKIIQREKSKNKEKLAAVKLKELFLYETSDRLLKKTPRDKFIFLKELLNIYFIQTKINKTKTAENEAQETIALKFFLEKIDSTTESIQDIKDTCPGIAGVEIFLAFFFIIKDLINTLWDLKNQLEKEKIIAPDEYKRDEHKLVKTLFSSEINSTPTDATSEEQTHQITNGAQSLFLT